MHLDLPALESSFDLVAPRGERLVDIFYARLFAAAPAVQPLFAHTDLRRQKTMLLGTLVLLRRSLRNPVVAEVLIASMAEIAGDAWRPEHERAWAHALDLVATAMLDGAASAQLKAAA
jgi:hemoglobin-like flavoprotein